MVSVHDPDRGVVLGELTGFRQEFYRCVTARADALFELCDAVLCAEGPVTSLPELSLSSVCRRGHGALYDGLAHGKINIARFERALALRVNCISTSCVSRLNACRRRTPSCWNWAI